MSDIESICLLNQQSFDLIISSFTLHWCEEIEKIFYDVRKSLKNDGIFMFTTVGPNTLKELQKPINILILNNMSILLLICICMEISLLKCGFDDPVMDVEEIIIEYSNF